MASQGVTFLARSDLKRSNPRFRLPIKEANKAKSLHRSYRYEQFEMELAQGKLEATEDDLADLDLVTHVDPIKDREVARKLKVEYAESKQMMRLSSYFSAHHLKRVESAAEKQATDEYASISSDFQDLFDNHDMVKDRRKYKVPQLEGRCEAELRREIRRLQRKLSLLREKNEEMEKYLIVLAKCRDTLIFEESAARVRTSSISSLGFDRRHERAQKGFKDTMKRLEGRVVPKRKRQRSDLDEIL